MASQSARRPYPGQFSALEPEFTCPAVEEHKTFHDSFENLQNYLLDVLGHEKVGYSESKVSPGKEKMLYDLLYDSVKLKRLMAELVDPPFIHARCYSCQDCV